MTTNDKERSSFDGMIRMVRFNWPMYAIAAGALIAVSSLALNPAFPSSVQVLSVLAAALIFFQSMASLAASYWVYDRSPLHNWHWLSDQCPGNHLRIVNVHSGYDETSGALLRLFPNSELLVIDLYPALARREPSIERARALYPPQTKPLCTTLSGWPLPDASVDVILIAFAAHELRQAAAREELFRQAKIALAPGGRIVLVEHLRDLSNLVAFGPGFVHFYPACEWRRCIDKAALKLFKCYKITPFVGVFVLCQ